MSATTGTITGTINEPSLSGNTTINLGTLNSQDSCTTYYTVDSVPYYVYNDYATVNGTGSYGTTRITIEDEGCFTIKGKTLKDYIKECFKTMTQELNKDLTDKEQEEMFDNFNFNFGPVNKDRIVMSLYGPAVKAKNITPTTYYAYDKQNGCMMDVHDMTFDFDMELFWKIPVAPQTLKAGDVIVQNNELYFVTGFEDEVNPIKGVRAINVASAKIETILPVCNMFNFNFVTKIVSLFNFGNAETATPFALPSADQPFGNLAPLMMMNMMKGSGKSDFNELMKTMMMMNMFNGANPFNQMFGTAG